MNLLGVVVFSLILSAVLPYLLSQRWLIDALIEAINNFRGGPPTAMHPSPSDDSVLLLRRSRKTDD